MEEMNKEIMENTVTEIVEGTITKSTFKENLMAYSLAGVFVTGLATIGYLGYKGTKRLSKKIRNKREQEVDLEQDEVTHIYDEEEIHDED